MHSPSTISWETCFWQISLSAFSCWAFETLHLALALLNTWFFTHHLIASLPLTIFMSLQLVDQNVLQCSSRKDMLQLISSKKQLVGGSNALSKKSLPRSQLDPLTIPQHHPCIHRHCWKPFFQNHCFLYHCIKESIIIGRGKAKLLLRCGVAHLGVTSPDASMEELINKGTMTHPVD